MTSPTSASTESGDGGEDALGGVERVGDHAEIITGEFDHRESDAGVVIRAGDVDVETAVHDGAVPRPWYRQTRRT